jgi:hypothetical protein
MLKTKKPDVDKNTEELLNALEIENDECFVFNFQKSLDNTHTKGVESI